MSVVVGARMLVPKFVRQSMSYNPAYTDPIDALKIQIIVSSIEATRLPQKVCYEISVTQFHHTRL